MPLSEDGLYRFEPPRVLPACAAVTLGDARDGSASDHRKVITKLHVNRGHASSHQLKRVLVESDGGNSHSANHVDEVLEQCKVCRAFDEAPHVLIAGTATASMFNEKVQAETLFLGDIFASRPMDMYSRNSLLLPVRPTILRRFGAPFVAVGRASLGHPRAS